MVNSRTDERVDAYPSRLADRATITPRLDAVVHGDVAGPLDPELLAAYEDDGFLVLPSLLAPHEVDVMNRELDRLAGDPAVRDLEQAVYEPDDPALRSLFEVHRISAAVRALVSDHRLVGVARQLLADDVYVHQSRANLKPGFTGREFYWHSDFETWHTEDGMPRMRALSCSVNLTENHSWNGPLLAIAGSHRRFVSCVGETPEDHYRESLRRQRYGVPDDESLRQLCDAGRIDACVGPPGTVVFFDCNLMHGSNTNISPYPRRNIFLVYNSVTNALGPPYAAPRPRPEFIASRDFTPV
jgi:ectoine hydroxylase